MESIQIVENGKYLPKRKVTSNQMEEILQLEKGYIEKRTGIKQRYYIDDETIEKMALKAVKSIFNKDTKLEEIKQKIGLIITATTTTNQLMPGISNYIQKKLQIKDCICLDILAGCSGYINAFDIARMYLINTQIEKALVIGVDVLSKFIEKKDINTSIILSDGAGATLIEKRQKEKKYCSHIISNGDNNEILTCKSNEYINMDGKEVYKYAVTKTVENIKELLEKSNENIENIKYIVPHQSNKKIMKSIASRLGLPEGKMYMDIERVGNTFCATIPIALEEMYEDKLLKSGDKIILLGYGGGLNTGSILLEI